MQSKIVIRLSDRIIKGTTELDDWTADFLAAGILTSPPICTAECPVERVGLGDVKAIFFVKSLAGTSHDELRYHDELAPLPSLWIRATFFDGEVVEGIVRNEKAFIAEPRFLMAPVDPDSNNALILVFKNQLANCQVLGLRKTSLEVHEYFRDSECELGS